ncbi:MAG: serine hydrolase [Gammaproteobacteria bacterium]|nr:serine hydrolase [Gammaproteobacteria bacterium]MXX06341.1 serine hydrolase [Gammaproteobacteria bacterium]MYE29035.1 serine hydrolase [Gammaproteobacteria bacterium]MYI00997.1 serine hydrolase [Gammaproteobacteria bacterium]
MIGSAFFAKAGTLLPAFVLCSWAHIALAQIGVPDPDALDAVLDRFVEEGHYPFLYARLEDRDGNVAYEHSVVNRDLLPDAEIDGQSWIRVWSMSKIVTISVVLDLVEDGVLSLEDPVASYIPEFSEMQVAVTPDGTSLAEIGPERFDAACPLTSVPADTVMTVRHLINHEAGFYYSTTGIPCIDSALAEQNVATAADSDDFIARLADLPLIQHPGTTYYYGINTTILGMVAERATGRSLEQLVEERLTGPLGIEGLQYDLPPQASLLPTISGQGGALRPAYPGELDIFGPDVPGYDPERQLHLGGEGMLANADGYADFLRMLLNHGTLNGTRFLETSTVEDIYSPHTQLDNPEGYNGFNLWVTGEPTRTREQGEEGLWVGGGYEGTHFWVDPKREFVGIIMSQIFWINEDGWFRDETFRGELYRQFWAAESQ